MSAVAVIKCPDYDPDRVARALARGLGLIGYNMPDGKLLLKPNVLIGRPPSDAVCTHPVVLNALLSMWPHAVYGDSPAARTGQDQNMALAEYQIDRWVPFEHPQTVGVPVPLIAPRLAIAKAVLDADIVVSVCKLKTHGYMHLTGAIKNQYGCLVGRAKTRYHNLYPRTEDFAKLLCDINKVVRPQLYIMDAIDAMEGPGPFKGTSKRLGYLLMSTDPVALDATACDLIDMPYNSVPTLHWGEVAKLGRMERTRVGDTVVQDMTFNCNRNPPSDMTRGWIERHLNILTADRPHIDKHKCTGCGRCVDACPAEPPAARPPRIDLKRCIRCYCCQEVCPQGAVSIVSPPLSRAVTAYRKLRRGH